MTAPPSTTWTEARSQLRLALPVVVIQVGLMAMGAVDLAFLGRVSAAEMAAVSLGHSYVFFFLGIAMGTLNALDPIVSQAFGAGEREGVARSIQRGLLLAGGLSLVVTLGLLPVESVLTWMRQPEEVVPIARDYVLISITSVPAFLAFVALRQSLQAMHRVRALVLVILLTNGLNAFLDWVLIHGNLGFPPLGARGSAWGTVIARWGMVALLPLLAGRDLRAFLWPIVPRVASLRPLGRTLAVGIPMGIQFGVEIGAFQAVLVLMGQLGTDAQAGHQATLTLASASFMVPLGLSMAASVRVGNAVGRGDPEAARRAARVAMVAGAAVMVVFGSLFLSLPGALVGLLTDLPEVAALAVVLLPLAGLFQVFDGVQVVALGCLRGIGDTRVPTLIHVAGFWALGIPLGYVLAFPYGLGAKGLWWGLLAALVAVAVVQGWRLRTRFAGELRRLVIEDGPQ